jgi:hypothetical protein
MVPLIVSDVAGGTGHFNLSLGAVGFGIGIGSTLSTPAAGWLADHFGARSAFLALMGIGVAAVLVAFVMPETRPSRESDQGESAPPEAGVSTPGDAVPESPPEDATPTSPPEDATPKPPAEDPTPTSPTPEPPADDAAPESPPGDATPKPPARRRA